MNCYRHPSRPAVGSCKACSKGLCLECAHDTKNGLACVETCIEEVKRQNRITDLSLVLMEKYLQANSGLPRLALHIIAGVILGAILARLFIH